MNARTKATTTRSGTVSDQVFYGSIPESAEYNSCEGERLNLGAESPFLRATDVDDSETTRALEDNWGSIPLHSSVAARKRTWRSAERDKKLRTTRRDVVDGDCGICFELAVNPCKTLCCGKLYCLEHLSDWLEGPSSDGRCPSCRRQCSLLTDTLCLSSFPSRASTPLRTPTTYHSRPSVLVPNPSPSSSRSRSSSPDSSSSSDSSSSQHTSWSSDSEVESVSAAIRIPLPPGFVLSAAEFDFLSWAASKTLSLLALGVVLYVLLA